MFDFITITKALAEENRLRILLALQNRELCVCQIIELLHLAPSTVSKHMSVLRNARLVEGRKDGRWTYYRLAGDDDHPESQDAIAWVYKHLSKDPKIQEDGMRMEQILKIDRDELCKQYS